MQNLLVFLNDVDLIFKFRTWKKDAKKICMRNIAWYPLFNSHKKRDRIIISCPSWFILYCRHDFKTAGPPNHTMGPNLKKAKFRELHTVKTVCIKGHIIRPEKFKKSSQKLVKLNKSISLFSFSWKFFFRLIAFLAVLNFSPRFLAIFEMAKNGFWSNKFREID